MDRISILYENRRTLLVYQKLQKNKRGKTDCDSLPLYAVFSATYSLINYNLFLKIFQENDCIIF